jgi:hypothetical protein
VTTATQSLAEVQRRLALALTAFGEASPAADGIVDSIVPGGTLDAAGALAVYRSGYLARLTEQLGETWASVWRVLGDDAFFTLCGSFIATHPSTSYNLSDYGRDFPAFLETVPEAGDVPMLAELARFELEFHDLFHAPQHAGLDTATLASVGDLAGVTMTLGSAVRLLACRRAVYDVFRHRNDEEPPDLDLERPQYVLMFKQDGEVLARELDAATFAALEALRDGLAVEDALARALERDANYGADEVARLFELIARCGLVVAMQR